MQLLSPEVGANVVRHCRDDRRGGNLEQEAPSAAVLVQPRAAVDFVEGRQVVVRRPAHSIAHSARSDFAQGLGAPSFDGLPNLDRAHVVDELREWLVLFLEVVERKPDLPKDRTRHVVNVPLLISHDTAPFGVPAAEIGL